ncbi:MAG: FprA family A-type flavoprotein [Lentisphaerae bacterium]|jgi:flavorubredoxin|nr:FprA family A-type flavoprotein [Lentisphaerota bacterium]
MIAREIKQGITLLASVHWERRLFDSLIPLPDGTSYNSYLVKGSEATALIDTSDPMLEKILMNQLADVDKIDYIVSNHTEQDHSGMITELVKKYPDVVVLCSSKAQEMLSTHLGLPQERFRVVKDGEVVSLGDKSLQFIYTPWVHWPETMCTYVPESKVLFSCDFLGSHLATTDVFVTDKAETLIAAKRYFAEIMMPFRAAIRNNLKKLESCDFDMVAPSHGPVYDDPQFIIDAYVEWTSDNVKNEVCLPYVSMHGSTKIMVDYLTDALVKRGVKVSVFDLPVTDLGALAMSLVDAATLIVAAPTVHVNAHPSAVYAAYIANMVRPKTRYAAIIGSYGWATKQVEHLAGMIPNIKAQVLGSVMQKGLPTEETFAQLDALADAVAKAHSEDSNIAK